MTKRILSIILVTIMLITLFTMTSCGAEQKYDYSGYSATSFYYEAGKYMDYIYEDTRLNINDDGTWKVDMEWVWFLRTNIDKGTYTVENGIYTFEGFEYGLKTTGKMTADGFVIYFADIIDEVTSIVTLYFDK